MRWTLGSSRQALSSGSFPGTALITAWAAASFVPGGSFGPVCPLVPMSPGGSEPPPPSGKQSSEPLYSPSREFHAPPCWEGARQNGSLQNGGNSTGQSLYPSFKTEGTVWDITLYLQAGKGTWETASEMKTDCWRIASLPRLHRPCPGTSVLAQFPVLLRGESPPCHHSSANLQVGYTEVLSAGDTTGGCKPCWQLMGSPSFRLQACPLPPC